MKARTGPGWAIALAVLLLVAIGPPAVGAPSSAARAPTTALVQSRAPDGTLTLIMGDVAVALGPAMTERMFIASA